ncbi:hypothetical protein P5P86_08805 [Nocardioides sp. BP30]|uniref:hypothetical protein n=1 Tax=Nocardioides sp. BP30 TaxID=3036374 RepID=UPI0024697339|nr:hypothetical protein [Nocardioides sp. BP30]WGL53912.1 hypothetical protein P5P86_08805 [Nocardioides sp. BP30]
MLTPAVLAVAVVVVIAVSSALDLEIEPYALAGVLAGAIVALIPDRSAWTRLGSFAVGFVAVWIGFLLRAGLLPDTEGGRAVAAVVTLVICLIALAVARGRLPLSAMLLGVVLFSASYEAAFVADEPRVVSTSLDAATALVFAVAVGFAVAVLSAGRVPAGDTAPDVTPSASTWSMRPRRDRLTDTAATTAAPNTEVTR